MTRLHRDNAQTADILQAGFAHAPVLAALHAGAFDHPWTADDFATLLADPGVFGLIAVTDGQPCGLALFRTVLDEAEVLTIGILPERRRTGLAATLMTAALTRAAHHGTRQVFLEVADSNAAAQGLYHRLGFSPSGRRKNYYRTAAGGFEDAVIMSLLLPLPAPTHPGGVR